MLAYYGYTISPNQIETGEGFLICRNVPIARTGEQSYLGSEIGLTGEDASRMVTVCRVPGEVFSEVALASFEGKPVTNDHPPCLIGPDDVTAYSRGHAEMVRRGAGEWADYVLADLHIQARDLIDAVRNGKREISCGYECEYVQNGDGTYSQKNIRGNHIAVVDRGRAGKRAAILDSDTGKKGQAERPERKVMKKQGFLFKLFGQAVKDKSSEEIEQLAMDAAAALDEESTIPAKEEKPETGEKEPKKKLAEDESAIDGIVDKVMTKLAVKEAEKTKKKEEAKDTLDTTIEQLSGDGAAEEASRIIPAGVEDKSCGMDKALAVGILKAMRPSVAAIGDAMQRKAVADALINLVTARDEKNDIAAILQASQKNAQMAADRKQEVMDLDAIQALYDNLNPHRRKERQ